MRNELLEILQAVVPPMHAREKEPMRRKASFRAGGLADYAVDIENLEMMYTVLDILKDAGQEIFMLGNGTNLLVSDKGFHGTVVFLKGDMFRAVHREGNILRAGSMVILSMLSRTAMKGGLSGLEPLSGIPGTIGGALTMNAGAFGAEMKDIVKTVTYIDLEKDGFPVVTEDASAMEFGYRTSVAKKRKICFLEATLELKEDDPKEIEKQMIAFAEERRKKQPLKYPSAGSTFKRPEGMFAGQLIEEAGLKGYRIGGAEVSEKHCGFIVNRGGATATDIYNLMELVKARVREHSGVTLEPEIVMLGDF